MPQSNYSIVFAFVLVLLITATSSFAGCPPGLTLADVTPPTDVSRTFIRSDFGTFGAPRLSGHPHTGVDILTRASFEDRDAYAVYAMADGIIAYAQFNGLGLDGGFGNVIIIDHENGCYTMYAHLSSDPFTPMSDPDAALLVSLGQRISKGEVIGYFVDMTKGVYSTGNAMKTAAGARWQTHIEIIEMPSGRRGPGTIGGLLGNDGRRLDPAIILLGLGYRVEGIAN